MKRTVSSRNIFHNCGLFSSIVWFQVFNYLQKCRYWLADARSLLSFFLSSDTQFIWQLSLNVLVLETQPRFLIICSKTGVTSDQVWWLWWPCECIALVLCSASLTISSQYIWCLDAAMLLTPSQNLIHPFHSNPLNNCNF